jgi:hypothetical protein
MSAYWYYRIRRALTVASYLLAIGVFATALAPRAGADELDSLHQQILRNPGNPELNVRFAQLAERNGYLRWALSAYERAILTDPNNADVLQGLTRVRRALQPSTTLVTVQLGAQYESNPNYYIGPRRSQLQGIGSASLLDESKINGTRWRTNAVAAGIVHQKEGDLNYAVAGLDIGPVLDAWPGWSFRPAIGGNVSYFDSRFYYSEVAASGTWESSADNMFRAVTVRGAYRSYNDFFPSTEGFYVEARGRLALPNVLNSGAVAIVSPWVVWSDIGGNASVVTPIITELQPGAYLEYGGRVDLIRSLTDWVAFGVNVGISQRDYRNDIVVASGDKRSDFIVSPGASLTFPNLFTNQTGLRLDYRFINDSSNDQTKSFTDHIVTASVIWRFDPTLPPSWATAQR